MKLRNKKLMARETLILLSTLIAFVAVWFIGYKIIHTSCEQKEIKIVEVLKPLWNKRPEIEELYKKEKGKAITNEFLKKYSPHLFESLEENDLKEYYLKASKQQQNDVDYLLHLSYNFLNIYDDYKVKEFLNDREWLNIESQIKQKTTNALEKEISIKEEERYDNYKFKENAKWHLTIINMIIFIVVYPIRISYYASKWAIRVLKQ